jgi:SAM-dependent methyltransferase
MSKLSAEHIKAMYNKSLVNSQYQGDYEFYRWFFNRYSWEDYRMLHFCLKHHLSNIKFSNCLEIGPGPGTWTKWLLLKQPDSEYQLIDVSDEMIKQASRNIGKRPNVKLEVLNFEEFSIKNKYDFVFSSRTLEYIPDKKRALKNIYESMVKPAKGFIITKNPNSLGRILFHKLGGKEKIAHTGQLKVNVLIKLMEETGFKKIETFPCTISAIPKFKCYALSRLLWKKFYKKPISKFSMLFSESYIVKFEK